MKEDVLFEEEQGFKQRWIEILFLFITIVLTISFLVLLFSKRDDREEGSIGLLIAIGLNFLVGYFLKRTRLVTQIRPDGVYVRFPPLKPSFTKYLWDDMQDIFVRKYNPLAEYGGWGIRIGPSGRAYNVSGNIGLQIVFKDGSKLLIGTNKEEEMVSVLSRLGKTRL